MSPPVTAEDQLKFVMSCLRNLRGGKIDFQTAAKESNVASSAAASMRWSRLMKANGLAFNPFSSGSAATSSDSPSKAPAKRGRKRKADTSPGDEGDGDDGNTTDDALGKPPVKKQRLASEEEDDLPSI